MIGDTVVSFSQVESQNIMQDGKFCDVLPENRWSEECLVEIVPVKFIRTARMVKVCSVNFVSNAGVIFPDRDRDNSAMSGEHSARNSTSGLTRSAKATT